MADHRQNGFRDGIAKTMRVDIVTYVVILGRGIQLFKLLDSLLIRETFAVTKASPEATTRKDAFEEANCRDREITLRQCRCQTMVA